MTERVLTQSEWPKDVADALTHGGFRWWEHREAYGRHGPTEWVQCVATPRLGLVYHWVGAYDIDGPLHVRHYAGDDLLDFLGGDDPEFPS